MKYFIGAILGLLLLVWCFSLCSPSGKNKTGHEYMPDMVHPVSYEANQYSEYHWNHWTKENQYSKYELSKPRNKVEGTVPRGHTAAYYGQNMDNVTGKNAVNAISVTPNGKAPFYFANTEEERLRCEKELVKNPFKISKDGLSRAKELYTVNCGICHGEKGDGNGYIYSRPDAKYPLAPKNFTIDEMIAAGNGRYYFGIMYGKNAMGSYADKLSFEERWQVIHYIRSLQAKAKSLKYNENENTLNNIDVPENAVVNTASALPKGTGAALGTGTTTTATKKH